MRYRQNGGERLPAPAGTWRSEAERERAVIDLGAGDTGARSGRRPIRHGPKSKFRRGRTPLPLSVALSPVSTQEPATCHASWSTSARVSPRRTGVRVCTYSAHPPKALCKYQTLGECRVRTPGRRRKAYRRWHTKSTAAEASAFAAPARRGCRGRRPATPIAETETPSGAPGLGAVERTDHQAAG